MELLREEDVDSLTTLEERIHQAIELVVKLRRERDAAVAERDLARRENAAAQERASVLAQEVESLRGERKQVRSRIEKLLGQIDSLSEG